MGKCTVEIGFADFLWPESRKRMKLSRRDRNRLFRFRGNSPEESGGRVGDRIRAVEVLLGFRASWGENLYGFANLGC